MGGVEERHTWTVKISRLSFVSVMTAFSLIPAGLLSDMNIDPQNLDGQQLAHRSTFLHHRLKRGWIWKELFVPEEDPTSRVIGQVKLQN